MDYVGYMDFWFTGLPLVERVGPPLFFEHGPPDPTGPKGQSDGCRPAESLR